MSNNQSDTTTSGSSTANNYVVILDQHERIFQWVYGRVASSPYVWGGHSAIGVESNGEIVAGAVYDHYTQQSIAIHFALDRPGRHHRVFLNWMFSYPFKQLKVKKLLAIVNADNLAVQKIMERLGFHLETRVAEVFLNDQDMLIYSMKEQDCKFL